MQQQQASAFIGVVFCTALALGSVQLATWPWLQQQGLGALIVAILVGMVLGNSVGHGIQIRVERGVQLSKHHALRMGIVLYGFNVTFQDVQSIGWWGFATDVVVILTVFFLGLGLGTKVFKLERSLAALIGAGSAVCGAAAVMATAPVIKAKAEHVAVAVATVVVFGTLCIFAYPVLITHLVAAGWMAAEPVAKGLFIGSSVHEVAQVVAIGKAIDPQTAQMAVIVKMVRVMLLAPFLMLVMALFSRQQTPSGKRSAITIPWFAFGFIAVAGVNSLHLLPETVLQAIRLLDTLLLCVAMVALGFTTQISVVRQAGIKPMLLASVLFVVLLSLSLGSVMWRGGQI